MLLIVVNLLLTATDLLLMVARVRSVPVQQKKSVSYLFLRNYSKNGNRYMNTVF